jgi:hypothetical protein
MHDKAHSVDVHATSGDVRGHEDSRLAGGESRRVTVARGLRKVAVQVDWMELRTRSAVWQAFGPDAWCA